MNNSIFFLQEVKTHDSSYVFIKNCHYSIDFADDNFYYVKRAIDHKRLPSYPISKDLEFTVYTTGEIIKGV
jgi:hypothetical protein